MDFETQEKAAEQRMHEASSTLLADTTTMLGRVEMYKRSLELAVKWREMLPPAYCQELIALDPQRAKT